MSFGDPKEIDGIPEDDSNVVLRDLYACAHAPKTHKNIFKKSLIYTLSLFYQLKNKQNFLPMIFFPPLYFPFLPSSRLHSLINISIFPLLFYHLLKFVCRIKQQDYLLGENLALIIYIDSNHHSHFLLIILRGPGFQGYTVLCLTGPKILLTFSLKALTT